MAGEDKTEIEVDLHDVIRFLNMIEDNNKTKDFSDEAKKNRAYVKVTAETVDFVQAYIEKNKLHTNEIGGHVAKVNMAALASAGDRFRCNFKRGSG